MKNVKLKLVKHKDFTMKKLFYGLVFLNLAPVCFSEAMVNKQFLNDVKTSWNEYYENQKVAEAFIKKTSQEALDDLLAGKFDIKATIAKIKNTPAEIWPYVSEESLTILAKNIRRNVNIEDYYSQEFIADLQALIEVPFEIYGKDNFLYPLKNGFFNTPLNQELKNTLVNLFGNTKSNLLNIIEICSECKQDSSNIYFAGDSAIMSVYGKVDQETTTLIDLLINNARAIADLCYSEEFKTQCFNLLDNRYKVTKIVKALTFRFVSETILDDALNIPRGEFNPVETMAFKFVSSQLAKHTVQ